MKKKTSKNPLLAAISQFVDERLDGPATGSLERRMLRNGPAKNFRHFWGKILDTQPRLRKIRDHEVVHGITRASLRQALHLAWKEAFAAGKAAR